MNTNLNAVLKMNPKSFYPKQVAKINFASTDYNFVNFEKNAKPSDKVQKRSDDGGSKSAAVTRRSSQPSATSAAGQSKTPHFYKGYYASTHV